MILKLPTEVRLIFYIAGLYGSFVYWGFLQEKLTSTEYALDNNQEEKYRWHFPFALNVFMALATFVAASIGNAMSPSKTKVPLLAFAKPAISCAMAAPIGYKALDFISFPLVVLTKSTKPVPVMLVGILLYSRTYPWYKYVSVIMLCGGISLFSFAKSGGKAGKEISALTQLIGIFLVGINLFLDGYTNNAQDYIFKRFHASPLQMMKYVNMWQFVYLLGYLLVCFVIWGGESETALAWRLFSNCASVRYDILMFCLCASVGQLFIFTVIQEFGSLLWVTISITRKLVTIFVSVIMFNHQISAGQWAGVGLVFAGMGLEVVMNYLAKQKPKKDDDTAENSSPGNKKIN